MNAHFENRFSPFITSDIDLCTPVVPAEMLNEILYRMGVIAESIVGEGAKPGVSYDLEHLQVAEYSTFACNDLQREAIYRLHAANPIGADDLAYLALRSMIGLHWAKIDSEDDIRRAAAYEKALEVVLTEVSANVAATLTQREARLPYWGRLAFLRVMTAIPEENLQAHVLDRVACVLLKDPVFNARSYQYNDHALIGLNFALEPILKGLNRMLLHFHHSQEMAGPKRMHRAWYSVAPVVGYFWLQTPTCPNRLTPYHVLFDPAVAQMSHAITADQVDFIVRHELGHLVLDHGRRLRSVVNPAEARALRNEFEFEADAFAHCGLRSALYNRLRSELQWESKGSEPAGNASSKALEALQGYQAESTAVRLLFVYMDGIERVSQLLKRRLGPASFRQSSGTHPSPRDRLSRLDAFHLTEPLPTSPLIRYAESFFSDVVNYAESLEEKELAAPLR